MRQLLHNAFAIITRHVPGRTQTLRHYLEDAPPEVVLEFHRIIQHFEMELDSAQRKARMPWLSGHR